MITVDGATQTPPMAGDDEVTVDAEEYVANYEARLDPEALLLCSLMWVEGVPDGEIATILTYLHPNDFRRPAHGRVFELMQHQAREGKLVTAAAIAGRIESHRDSRGWPDGHHGPLLVALSGLRALPAQATFYAEQVLAESYRRQYASMVTELSQVAKEAPEGELFSILVCHGTTQRVAWQRRQGFMRAITNPATDISVSRGTDAGLGD